MSKHALKDDPKRPYKAYIAAAGAAITAFATYWIADTDPFTLKEAAQGGLLALAASGITGIPTFLKSNPQTETASVAPREDANGDRFLDGL